jgi:hypothetical protein
VLEEQVLNNILLIIVCLENFQIQSFISWKNFERVIILSMKPSFNKKTKKNIKNIKPFEWLLNLKPNLLQEDELL